MQPFTLSARFYPPDLLKNSSLSPSSSTFCARPDYSHQQGNISLFLGSHFWIISSIPLALPLTSLFFAPLCNTMSRGLVSYSPQFLSFQFLLQPSSLLTWKSLMITSMLQRQFWALIVLEKWERFLHMASLFSLLF